MSQSSAHPAWSADKYVEALQHETSRAAVALLSEGAGLPAAFARVMEGFRDQLHFSGLSGVAGAGAGSVFSGVLGATS